MSAGVIDLSHQPLRHRHIVGIHARNILATRLSYASIESGNQTRLRLGKHSYPRVCIRPGNLDTVICRAIVDNKKLKIGERLDQNALDSFTHIALAVVDGHDNRDGRRTIHTTPPSAYTSLTRDAHAAASKRKTARTEFDSAKS